MAAPQTPYEAVLHAARDVTKLDCALDAEMLGTALLGSVYAVAENDRAAAVREFVGEFLTATARRRTAAATTIRTVFAALVPDAPGAAAVKPGAQAPSWSAQLGKVRLTGTYAYGDVYGDQTSYLATFAYDDDESGGPEHAVVALVDHNIGITKDVFVGGPAERILDQVRQMCADGRADLVPRGGPAAGCAARWPGTWRSPTSWATCRRRARSPTDRALVGARLALLPSRARGRARPEPSRSPPAARPTWCARSSPHRRRPASASTRCPRPTWLAALLHEPGARPRGEPARRRPAALEPGGRRALPARLGAPAGRARHGRRGDAAPGGAGLGGVRVAQARPAGRGGDRRPTTAVEEMVPEFARLYTTGERRSPATAAVAQLIAEGVDPDDPDALDAWIAANRHRLADDGA